MSTVRHEEPQVRGYAVTHPVGEVHLPTQPGWHQVLYARAGTLVAVTPAEAWTVPTHRALCIGDGTAVRVRTTRPTAVRCLYLATGLAPLAPGVTVVDLTPLTRELLLHAVARSPLDLAREVDRSLVTLLLDQLAGPPARALRLPLPADPRARVVTDAVLADPAAPLAGPLAAAPASRRTVERLVRTETGMPLGLWRRRARVLAAVALLDGGATVTEAGAAVGYATPSAFVVAVRAELGCTPSAFRPARLA